jgi:hypothetical protein
VITRPITSLTFRAGEPAWSVAIGQAFAWSFYLMTLFLWWASGSKHILTLGLLASFALTPLPPINLLLCLIRPGFCRVFLHQTGLDAAKDRW